MSATLLSWIARAAPTPEVLLSANTPARSRLAVSASLTCDAAVLMSLLFSDVQWLWRQLHEEHVDTANELAVVADEHFRYQAGARVPAETSRADAGT